jgi:hypothetical protein
LTSFPLLAYNQTSATLLTFGHFATLVNYQTVTGVWLNVTIFSEKNLWELVDLNPLKALVLTFLKGVDLTIEFIIGRKSICAMAI